VFVDEIMKGYHADKAAIEQYFLAVLELFLERPDDFLDPESYLMSARFTLKIQILV